MITFIDFHIDDHLVQIGDGTISIFKNGDRSKKPIEFDSDDIARALKVGADQLDTPDDDYALGA